MADEAIVKGSTSFRMEVMGREPGRFLIGKRGVRLNLGAPFGWGEMEVVMVMVSST
jgi:hypothetical protein